MHAETMARLSASAEFAALFPPPGVAPVPTLAVAVEAPPLWSLDALFSQRCHPLVPCAADAPTSSLRVLLVCTLLDTCGQYFAKGPTRCAAAAACTAAACVAAG